MEYTKEDIVELAQILGTLESLLIELNLTCGEKVRSIIEDTVTDDFRKNLGACVQRYQDIHMIMQYFKYPEDYTLDEILEVKSKLESDELSLEDFLKEYNHV